MLLNLAMDTLESLRCPGECGQFMDESQDADTDGWWVVDTETVCYACAAIQQHKAETKKDDVEPGTLVRLYLDPDYERSRASRSAPDRSLT